MKKLWHNGFLTFREYEKTTLLRGENNNRTGIKKIEGNDWHYIKFK